MIQNNNSEETTKYDKSITINQDMTVMVHEPFAGDEALEIKYNLDICGGYIDSFGLAHVFANVRNEISWLLDEIDCDPPGCSKEEFEAWLAIDSDLCNRIIEIIKQWNEDGTEYPTDGIGTQYIVMPFMEMNGYELANGWWVEKPDGREYPDYVVAHDYSANHKPSLINDKKCGCFYCLEIFNPNEINDWLEGTKGDWEGTAICPYCGIDSVIGESSGYPITKEFLSKMHSYWFDSLD